MTNEQLTQEIIKLHDNQARAEAEHEKFEMILKELQEDVKTTKSLAEDVHIMAINMQNMQKTVDATNKKVEALSLKEFTEYEENKKTVKRNIINKITDVVTGAVITAIGFFILFYLNNR